MENADNVVTPLTKNRDLFMKYIENGHAFLSSLGYRRVNHGQRSTCTFGNPVDHLYTYDHSRFVIGVVRFRDYINTVAAKLSDHDGLLFEA